MSGLTLRDYRIFLISKLLFVFFDVLTKHYVSDKKRVIPVKTASKRAPFRLTTELETLCCFAGIEHLLLITVQAVSDN